MAFALTLTARSNITVMKVEKVAWIIGQNPVNQDKIRERGYSIREFKTKGSLRCAMDEQPDLIIFSEADIQEFTILSQIRDFYPEVIVLSLPPQPVEREEVMAQPIRTNSPLEESMGRLLSAIKRIENA
jgi:hypothetical protein